MGDWVRTCIEESIKRASRRGKPITPTSTPCIHEVRSRCPFTSGFDIAIWKDWLINRSCPPKDPSLFSAATPTIR